MSEIYKPVLGFEGLYEVSNAGNVRGVKKGSILKPSKDKKGYLRVYLSKQSKQKTIRIHILVADAFLNRLDYDLHVDHIDNNKENNNLSNLQLLTNRANCSKDKQNKTSKYTGVSYDKSRDRWCAEIRDKNKRYRLGRFINENDANEAYKAKLKEISNNV